MCKKEIDSINVSVLGEGREEGGREEGRGWEGGKGLGGKGSEAGDPQFKKKGVLYKNCHSTTKGN